MMCMVIKLSGAAPVGDFSLVHWGPQLTLSPIDAIQSAIGSFLYSVWFSLQCVFHYVSSFCDYHFSSYDSCVL